MISEFEFFHGAVLARMLHSMQRSLAIAPYSKSDNASYVVNEKGLYIKYCSKRMSPWRFSFQSRHYDSILEMKRELGDVFVVLVCNDDGAVVLSFDEFQQVICGGCDSGQWISASRKPRQMYLIKGSDGQLAFKIGTNELAEKIFGDTGPN